MLGECGLICDMVWCYLGCECKSWRWELLCVKVVFNVWIVTCIQWYGCMRMIRFATCYSMKWMNEWMDGWMDEWMEFNIRGIWSKLDFYDCESIHKMCE